MNQIHLARILGGCSSSAYHSIQKVSLFDRIEPQLDIRSQGRALKDLGQGPDATLSTGTGLIAHAAGTNCLTIDDNYGRFLVSGGAEATIHLFDLEAEDAAHIRRPAASLPRSSRGAHTHAISAVTLYPFDPTPSTLFTASHDKTAKVVSITPTSLKPVHTFPLGYAPYTLALSQLPSAHPLVAVGTAHPATRLFDLRSGLTTHSLPGHNGGVYSIAWSPKYEHVLASGAHDGRVLFFDIRRANAAFGSLDLDDAIGVVGDHPYRGDGARKPLDWNARAHAGPVTGVQWTSDGSKLVTSAHDNRLRVWDAATGRNDLVHFGPRIRNDRIGPLMPLLSPPSFTRPGEEILYWPNDDGKGDIYVHSLREGNLIRVLSTPGVQRTHTPQGKKNSIEKLTSGGRVNALVWRVNAASGQSVELYSAHGDGSIHRWAPADGDEDFSDGDKNNDKVQQMIVQTQAKKRKRELVGDLVAGLSSKSL